MRIFELSNKPRTSNLLVTVPPKRCLAWGRCIALLATAATIVVVASMLIRAI